MIGYFGQKGDSHLYTDKDIGRYDGQSDVSMTKLEMKYCSYCKKQTPHKVVDTKTDGHGTGRDLRCTKCGSARLGEIQGFDAALM